MGQLPEDKTVIHIVINKKDRKRLELFMKGQDDGRDRNISAAGRILLLRSLDAFFSSGCSDKRTAFDSTPA